MFVPLRRAQTWRLHTKLYKFGWHISANDARMKSSRHLILGEAVNVSIIYLIPDSWPFLIEWRLFLVLITWLVNHPTHTFFGFVSQSSYPSPLFARVPITVGTLPQRSAGDHMKITSEPISAGSLCRKKANNKLNSLTSASGFVDLRALHSFHGENNFSFSRGIKQITVTVSHTRWKNMPVVWRFAIISQVSR